MASNLNNLRVSPRTTSITTSSATVKISRDVACVSALPATQVPGGCTGATIAGYTISSPTVTVTPKKK